MICNGGISEIQMSGKIDTANLKKKLLFFFYYAGPNFPEKNKTHYITKIL